MANYTNLTFNYQSYLSAVKLNKLQGNFSGLAQGALDSPGIVLGALTNSMQSTNLGPFWYVPNSSTPVYSTDIYSITTQNNPFTVVGICTDLIVELEVNSVWVKVGPAYGVQFLQRTKNRIYNYSSNSYYVTLRKLD